MAEKKERKFLPTYEVWSRYRGSLMGFAILTVIAVHFFKDCSAKDVQLPWAADMFMVFFGSAGVDIFLFLSGLGLYYSLKRKGTDFQKKSFYFDKIVRVLIPYFLIAGPAHIYNNVFRTNAGWGNAFLDFTFVNFVLKGEVWFWYIGMICICYLIFPYLFRFADKAKNSLEEDVRFLLLFALVTALNIVLVCVCREVYFNINGAMLRFFPFILGTFIGKKSYEHKPITWIHLLVFIPWVAFRNVVRMDNTLLTRYGAAVNALVISFLLCLFFYYTEKVKWHPIRDSLAFIGKYTLELYLTHVMVRRIMTWQKFRPYTIPRECLMLLISVLLSAAVHVLSAKIRAAMIRLTQKKSM